MPVKTTPYLVSLVGPTAVGKTSLAIKLAQHFNTEILSADSRQFFKELNIGTAKATIEEQKAARHHFINNRSISEDYNASDFEKEAIAFLDQFYQQHSIAIMCGGSGMYVDAILKGFDDHLPSADPQLRERLQQVFEKKGIESLQKKLLELDPVFYEKVDRSNPKRLLRAIEVCLLSGQAYSSLRKGEKQARNFKVIKIGIERDRKELYERINKRVDIMLQEGLLDEVKSLSAYQDKNALKTVGYQELFAFLRGECSFETAVDKIKVNSRRYAKRQLTWFKKDSEVKWFQADAIPEIIEYIRNRFIAE